MVKTNCLRKMRKLQKMALLELSTKSGISTPTLVAIELYQHYPTPNIRSRLVTTLGISENVIWPVLGNNDDNGK
ncbi:MAG: helix-turn-helix transcriptional regulator [Dehalococcoidia bacterium]